MKKIAETAILILMTLALTSAACAATWTVSKVGDTNDGVCNADCSLREAIAAAAAGDTIFFGAIFDSPQTISVLSQLLIDKSLTIVGKGARNVTIMRPLAATTAYRVLEVSGGPATTVHISGITIRNGSSDTKGGGISGSVGQLNLDSVTIRNNASSSQGGGLSFSGTGLTITNSTIYDNSSGNGAGIYITGTLRLSNSTITQNIASWEGGGVYSIGESVFTNVTISHNSAVSAGGAFRGFSGGTLRPRNTIFSNNTAHTAPNVSSSCLTLGNNLVDNSADSTCFANGINGDLVGTTAAPLNPQLGALQNNGGGVDTRVLLPNSPALDAGNNCVTTLSCPNNNPPAALFLDQRGAGFPRLFASSVDIGAFEAGTGAVVNGNDSGPGSLRQVIVDTRANGVILIRIPQYASGCNANMFCIVTLTTGELAINKSLDIRGTLGGARATSILRSGTQGTPNFRLFSVTGTGTILRLNSLTVSGGNPAGNGGAIQVNSGATLTLDQVAVSNNVGSAGGAIMNFGSLFIEGSTLSGNHATNDSGVIRNNGTAVIYNSTLSGNRSNNNAGAILNFGTLTLINTTVTGNSGNVGGGVYSAAGGINLRNSLIAANVSGNGDVRTDVFGPLTSHGNNLIGNGAGSSGLSNGVNGDLVGTFNTPITPRLGPLAPNGGGTDTHMLLPGSAALDAGNNCVVAATCPTLNVISPLPNDQRDSGTTRQFGSAVDIGAFELRVENVSNTSDSGPGSLRQTIITTPPGSIINLNYPASTPGCSGGVCTIDLTSGSLYLTKSVTIVGPGARNLIIQRSPTAGTPGFRVLRIDAFYTRDVTVNLSGLTIANGRGGIYAGYCQLNLDGVAVRSNQVADAGAGLFVLGSTVNIVNSAIHNNSSVFDSNPEEEILGFGIAGGGIYALSSSLNIANTTVSENVSVDVGGGIASSGSLTMNNVTVSHNRAIIGGGLFITSGGAFIRNTIVAKNIDTDGINHIPDVSGTFTSLGDNLIGNNTGAAASFPAGNPNANGDLVGTGAAPVDPQLGPLTNNGGTTDTRALLNGSPALNTGNNCVTNLSCPANNPIIPLATDQRGANFPRLFGGTVDVGSVEAQTSSRPTAFDFDGDGKTDLGIFRPSTGQWWVNRSSNGITFNHQFGASSDRIAPADFTGDGKADIAIWRPSTGEWFVLRSEDSSYFSFAFGTNGDIPSPADFDNDGKADPAVYRPSNATWYIQRSTGGFHIEQFGANGDVPVASDYDGDGRADLAIFRPSNGQWWLKRSTAGVIAATFGNTTDKPTPGDFTGDGKTDIAIFRPSSGEWFVLRSEDFSYFAFPFGTNGDVPAVGDYDGDGRSDATVFRPSNATWYVQQTAGGISIRQFGVTGDRPAPNAYVP